MAWYDPNWNVRKKITITENSGNALVNFQVKLLVVWASGMRSDFGDLRFTKADGITLVNYWVEEYTASTSATVWIKVDTLPASGSTDIYMYYANPSATNIGDGVNTFLLFDDFNGTTLDTTKWVATSWATGGSHTVSGGYIEIRANSVSGSSGSYSVISKDAIFAGSVGVVRVKAKEVQYGGTAYWELEGIAKAWITDNGISLGSAIRRSGGNKGLYTKPSGSGIWNTFAMDETNYNIYEIKINSTNSYAYDKDGVQLGYTTNGEAFTKLKIGAWAYAYGFDGDQNPTRISLDWLLAREYASAEPTSIFGPAESPSNQYHINSVARIKTTFEPMLISIARIKKSIGENISCSGIIKIIGYQSVINSSGRILKQYSNNLASESRIKASSDNTIASDSRIVFKQSYQINSNAKILTTFVPYLTSDSRLKILDMQENIDSESRIKIAFNQNNIDTNSRIIKPASDIISSNSVVKLFNMRRPILSDSRMVKSFSDIINSDARINKLSEYQITSDSRIKKELYNQITINARILLTKAESIGSESRIEISYNYDLLSDARIIATETEILNSNSRLKKEFDTSIDSNSRIKISYNYNLLSNARIIAVKTRTINSDSRIKKQFDTSIDSDSRIKIIYSDNIFSTARIMTEEFYLLTSNSRIKRDFQKQVRGNAMISMIFAGQLDFNARIATPLGFVRGDRWFTKM